MIVVFLIASSAERVGAKVWMFSASNHPASRGMNLGKPRSLTMEEEVEHDRSPVANPGRVGILSSIIC